MKVDLSKLRGHPDAALLVADLVMVLLVLFNLAWLVFNTLFGARLVQAGIAWLSPEFHAWYRDEIFPHFLDYDTLFVAVYVVELLLRWAIAVFRGTYHRWFFYPFVHWYDVLGCIPVGSFRWLRVLRAVALLWRLQQVGVIDLRDTWLVRTASKYLDILTEEISDRVVINVLDGVHDELARGNPVVHRIGSEVLAPRRAELVDWLAGRLQAALAGAYEAQRPDLHDYLARVVAEGMSGSAELRTLEAMPVIGPALIATLDGAVTDIARTIADRAVEDLASTAGRARLALALGQALDAALADDARIRALVRDALLESIALVKQQVSVQQWKLKEAEGHYD